MDWETKFAINIVQLNTGTILFCNFNLCDFVSAFIDALDSLGSQSEVQKSIFLPIETARKRKAARVFGKLSQRRSYESKQTLPKIYQKTVHHCFH